MGVCGCVWVRVIYAFGRRRSGAAQSETSKHPANRSHRQEFFSSPFFFPHIFSLLLRILSRSSACEIVLLGLATCVKVTVNQMKDAGFS
jgi:hypothetical protein